MKNKLDQIDEQLHSIPKPRLTSEKKERIHEKIMRTDEYEESGRWMRNIKGYSAMVFSVIALALFSIILFSGDEKDSTPSSHLKEEYISYLSKVEVHDVIEADTAYIGNSSAVSVMGRRYLPGGDFINGFELETSNEPMGIIINYKINEKSLFEDETEAFSSENLPFTLLYNATTYFTFFKNGDFVTFQINYIGEERSITITRDEINQFYGVKDVRVFAENEETWKQEIIENGLKDENKVAAFFENKAN